MLSPHPTRFDYKRYNQPLSVYWRIKRGTERFVETPALLTLQNKGFYVRRFQRHHRNLNFPFSLEERTRTQNGNG